MPQAVEKTLEKWILTDIEAAIAEVRSGAYPRDQVSGAMVRRADRRGHT